ncbi:MAG: hypothetical protein MJ067_01885 [Oscillospiraceae bacterium]|nr:hypothetical protein [Oscillospiraceae bacterium]
MQIFDISRAISRDSIDFSGFPEATAVLPAKQGENGDISLEPFCGKCRLLSFDGVSAILPEKLKGRIAGVKRLCLKSADCVLTEEAINYIAAAGVELIVLDRPYVGTVETEKDFKAMLASAGVSVVINADFKTIRPGDYMLFCFPVNAPGKSFLPVRPVLIPA